MGKRELEPLMGQKLGTAILGEKEISGQSHNELGFVQTLDDPRRFFTSYQLK